MHHAAYEDALRRRADAFEAQLLSKTMPRPRGAPSSGVVPSNGAFQSSGYSGAISFSGSFPSGGSFPLGAGFHSGSSSSSGGSVQAGVYTYGGSANGRGSGSPISPPATAAPWMDAIGRQGITLLQKCTAAIHMLVYGTSADLLDDQIKLAASMSLECLGKFVEGVIEIFGPEYLRPPNVQELDQILQENKSRGFSGMLGSIDCMHWA